MLYGHEQPCVLQKTFQKTKKRSLIQADIQRMKTDNYQNERMRKF